MMPDHQETRPQEKPQRPAFRRFVRITLPISAGLAACILLVHAHAQWGNLLPEWKPQELVAQYKAWKNRPKPLNRCEITVSPGGTVTFDEDGQISDCTDHPFSHSYWPRSLARFQRSYYSRCRKLDLRIAGNLDGDYAAFWLDAAVLFESATVFLLDGNNQVTREVALSKIRHEADDRQGHCTLPLKIVRLRSGELCLKLPGENDLIIEPSSLPDTLVAIANKAAAGDQHLGFECLHVILAPTRDDTVEDWVNITSLAQGDGVAAISFHCDYKPGQIYGLSSPPGEARYSAPATTRSKRPGTEIAAPTASQPTPAP